MRGALWEAGLPVFHYFMINSLSSAYEEKGKQRVISLRERMVTVTEVNWKFLFFIILVTLVVVGVYVWWMPSFTMNPMPRPLIPA